MAVPLIRSSALISALAAVLALYIDGVALAHFGEADAENVDFFAAFQRLIGSYDRHLPAR